MQGNDLRDEAVYEQLRRDQDLWRRARVMGLPRRRFLAMLAAGGASAALGGSAAGLRRIARSAGAPTPDARQAHPNHSPTPRIDPAAWRLRVEGSGVARPLELTYNDLLSLPDVSVRRYVECAGNGRSFFEVQYGQRASGTQWRLGAVGAGLLMRWTLPPRCAWPTSAAEPSSKGTT